MVEPDAPKPPGTTPAPEELIGTVVAQKFEVVGYLDRGSIGAVYRAIQRPIGREVVLKVLRPSLTTVSQTDPEFAERFRREAETYGKLRHANTVTLFDYGEDRQGDEPIYFMALEYVRGITLRALLGREGRLGVERTLRIAIQICRSLREAHGHGIVHRDLKPGNVMIVDGEEGDIVKVLDFGIAKVRMPDTEDQEGITRVGVLLGSPGYMAPEQIRSGIVDPRTDLYALGCVLFQMLAGVTPFRADSPIDTCSKHLTAPVPTLDQAAGGPIGVPVEVEALIRRCLEKRAEDRFQTVDDLLFALQAVSDGGTAPSMHLIRTSPPPPPRPGPTGLIPSRSAAMWVSVGLLIAGVPALLLGLLTLVAVLASMWEPPEDAAVEEDPVVVEEVPAPEPEPAPAQQIRVTVRSEPAGAEVWDGDTLVGPTPAVLTAPPAGRLELRKAGYRDEPVDWASLVEAGEVTVRLTRPATRPRPTPKPDGFVPDVRTER